jgi:tRNA nucleotidyltransferase (CCA-adding enzyme)
VPEVRGAAQAADLALPLRVSIGSRRTIASAAGSAEEAPWSSIPVVEAGRVVGSLDLRTLNLAVDHGLGDLRVAEIATEPPSMVRPDTGIDELRALLRSTAQPLLLVGRGPGQVRGAIPRQAGLDEPWERPTPVRQRPGLARRLEPARLALLREVGKAARRNGATAYLVGGAVRDLLHHGAIRDLDVVVVGDAHRVARALGHAWGARLRWHERFQTAVVERPDGERVDLARARTELYPRPAALPRVAPAELLPDLQRRDFTVNAMAISILPRQFGTLIDPFGGRSDLATQRIRVLHGLSYIEDPSRMLRAVRFAATLDFEIEATQTRLIRAAVRRGFLGGLSPARLGREIRLTLGQRRVYRAVRLAQRLSVWSAIEPTLRPLPSSRRALERLEALLLRGEGLDEEVELWSAVLGQVMVGLSARARRRLLERLRPPRRSRRVLERLESEVGSILTGLRSRRVTPSRVYRACHAASPEAVLVAAIRARGARVRGALLAHLRFGRHVRPEITGRDLLRAGVRAGPRIAIGLEAALMAKLDGRAGSRDRQLAVALRSIDRA